MHGKHPIASEQAWSGLERRRQSLTSNVDSGLRKTSSSERKSREVMPHVEFFSQ